ncbi:uncharacterized protein C8orf74 homolog [Psammomys obesus]|uniref:uncharacterized protein C8orf74 homolog n=1 Tax=Psammomys obesus TaxID=48139 RepID=UPI002452A76D|nr:uncharacterized protein C8orf74 homolog [Psammomys obesus]
MALLTPQGVKEVFQFQKPKGREHLRRLLNWKEFDELRDARQSILLDTLYDSIIFAVGKGFPWVEVVQVVKFTEELLEETKGCSITEAVTILGTKLRVYQKQFNATHLLALCDYFHNTFIRHYRLYQFVLSQDQEVNLTVAHVQMCAPPQPLPLTEGTNSDVWRHEQQMAELSTAEVQKRTNVLLLKETLLLEQAHMLQKAFGVQEAPEQLQSQPTLRREALERLVREAINIQITCLQELLQYEIQAAFDILDLRLQKKTLSLCAPPPPLPCITAGQAASEDFPKASKASKGKKAKAKK